MGKRHSKTGKLFRKYAVKKARETRKRNERIRKSNQKESVPNL